MEEIVGLILLVWKAESTRKEAQGMPLQVFHFTAQCIVCLEHYIIACTYSFSLNLWNCSQPWPQTLSWRKWRVF